eukprot:TRINITY_DN32726_c0_g1_i1.p1 TRINITY_DN32726_c0_g1~~TRINITY_DN32726_c0_g1_i1.p1  ORF type:complete len:195 (+),score=34.45 TRINITY_DN32726_c0_g1_i1:126-710(+)
MLIIWVCLTAAATGGVTLNAGSLALTGGDWFGRLFVIMTIVNLVMFCFNALVPCFPLDCSAIVVNTLAIKGVSPDQIAKWLLISSGVVILGFCGYALYLLIQLRFLSCVSVCLMAGYLGYNSWLIHKARENGTLQQTAVFNDRSQNQQVEQTLFEKMFADDQRPKADNAPGGSDMDLGLLLAIGLVAAHVLTLA